MSESTHVRKKPESQKNVKLAKNSCAIACGFGSNWVKFEMRDNTSFSFKINVPGVYMKRIEENEILVSHSIPIKTTISTALQNTARMSYFDPITSRLIKDMVFFSYNDSLYVRRCL